MKKRLLAIGLAAAALAAAPAAFASGSPPTATAGPPAALANNDVVNNFGTKDVDSTLLLNKDLVAADKMAAVFYLRVTANDARSPLVARDLTADKIRPAVSEDGTKALVQKKAPEGTAKKLLAASAGHPGIGIAWAIAPAANTAKVDATATAGEKHVMNAATIRASPSITLKV